ncbi:GTPase inhibitor [Pseudohyphozyma bogoriensis]|nr:GTPase inhibitor [Pseudohyphozyma bogoriensis]
MADQVASSSSTKILETARVSKPSAAQEEDVDALFEELEGNEMNDFDLGGFREKRMEQLRAEVQKATMMRDSNYGKLTEMKVEKDVIAAMANAPRSVLHFFHRDFRRCKIMDRHLEKLAAKHFDTLFIRAEVSNVPFLVNKMEVKVLPCVIGFAGGISKMKIIGFEELEGGDNFSTASLELTMLQCEVLNPTPGKDPMRLLAAGMAAASSTNRNARRGIRGRADDDDDELDLYD